MSYDEYECFHSHNESGCCMIKAGGRTGVRRQFSALFCGVVIGNSSCAFDG